MSYGLTLPTLLLTLALAGGVAEKRYSVQFMFSAIWAQRRLILRESLFFLLWLSILYLIISGLTPTSKSSTVPSPGATFCLSEILNIQLLSVFIGEILAGMAVVYFQAGKPLDTVKPLRHLHRSLQMLPGWRRIYLPLEASGMVVTLVAVFTLFQPIPSDVVYWMCVVAALALLFCSAFAYVMFREIFRLPKVAVEKSSIVRNQVAVPLSGN